MVKHIFLFSLAIAICSAAPLVQAEDARGRLPDGRAYRTDAAGMQLVDYIAELEVSMQELKRRVHGLQYEVEEKEDIIAALKRNGAATPAIVEKDLLNQKAAREMLAVPLNAPKQQCPEVKACPETQRCPEVFDCDVQVEAVRKQFDALVEKNDALLNSVALKEKDIATYKQQIALLKSKEGTRDARLQAALDREQMESKQMLSNLGTLRSELEAVKRKEVEASTQLAQLQRERSSRNAEESLVQATLTTKNEALLEQVESLQSKLSAAREQLAELEQSGKRENTVVRASLSPRALGQIKVARSELMTAYNRTRGMASERDKRFKLQRQSTGRAVQVSLSPLRSKRGVSLKQISARIAALRSMEEASALRRDLLDIQQVVKADKQLLSRMANL